MESFFTPSNLTLSGRPELAPGESQLAVADGVDVEATELGLKTPMKGGTAVVTTSRVVWVAPPSPAGPSAVSVSLHHIADCKLKQLPFGARVFGPSRVRLQLRADLEGRPAGALTSPVRLLKAYLALKSGADRLHQAIVTGLAQLPQSAPGPSGAPGTSGPSPPVSVYERAGSEAVTVDAGALQRLVEMGIERGAAREALIATQGRPLQEAVEWQFANASNRRGPPELHASSSAPVLSPAEGPSAVGQGGVGLARVRAREEERIRQQSALLEGALGDLDSLMQRAKDVVKLAEEMAAAVRSAREGEGEGEADAEDVAMMQSVVLDMGITNPVTREMAGGGFEKELARELCDFLLRPRAGPAGREAESRPSLLADRGGMVAMTDLWYFFNRARGTELVSPDELIAAVKLFGPLGLPLGSSKVGPGVVVVHSPECSPDALVNRIAALVDAPGTQLGPGVTAAEVAAKLSVALALSVDLLTLAEERGRLCRDEGGREGIVYYRNVFPLLSYAC